MDEWNISPFTARYIAKQQQKTKKNRKEKRKVAKESKHPGAATIVAFTTVWLWQPPRPIVVTRFRPWWPLAGGGLTFLLRCLLVLILFRGFCLCWVILGPFSYLLWSFRPQKHRLILSFRLVNLNSAKTLKTSKTTHNRRNRDISRITIHFNPLKGLLNTYLIHANVTLITPPSLNFCLSSSKTL